MGAKDKWNRGEVWPQKKHDYPKFDQDAALAHELAYICVDGIKLVLKGAGKVIEFGVGEIVNNDGSKTRTKKR